jgi:hypothetical protein
LTDGFFVDSPLGLVLLLLFTTFSSAGLASIIVSVSSSSSLNERFLNGSERADRCFIEEVEVYSADVLAKAIEFARANVAILLLV